MTPETTARAARSGDLRARMLEAAERLLNSAPGNDISTRAVCEAVGVTQPILYRLFGDKNGLLAALVENGFERYISRKQALEATDDPVADLRAGWDDHTDFALTHRALYRLMFSPVLPEVPAPADRIFELLKQTLDRCAAVGAVRIPTEEAAQAILSANVGVALSILSQPSRFRDPLLSARVRDAVFASCLDESAAARPAPDEGPARAALCLEARLRDRPPEELRPEETALLLLWLGRLQRAAP
ncbi:putative TetR family transcritpional regulator [Actinacidiphila reveromycinica]|uniref:Putative TetR family transcritpional regulator n=1 Tax=Actinacidiphila reveromycinica TaxID=659352 RepID=A0A7U3URC8_9ACTN|nr:TetR/AcrR family transcriptional regulator [Streptomyces sp. SN-593]BBA97236.1 putative TetR family transcritpional regulator [Streptomyces sp. SN-593]